MLGQPLVLGNVRPDKHSLYSHNDIDFSRKERKDFIGGYSGGSWDMGQEGGGWGKGLW
jgi:hypothetical protein